MCETFDPRAAARRRRRDRRRRGQPRGAARRRARRLDEHGELHHRLSGDGEPDAGRGRRGARPRARASASSIACSTRFFEDEDAALLAGLGVNCVRIPVNYRHFERDERPFELREEGFERLDRVVRAVRRARHLQRDRPARGARLPEPALALRQPDARRRLLAAPALPGPRRAPVAGVRRALPRRAVGRRATTCSTSPPTPAARSSGPFHDRLVAAVREIDRDHIVFVDGNTYSTDFSMFAEPYENAVYACHDYARAGMAFGGPVPGRDPGPVDRPRLPRGEVPRALALPARDRARRSGSASSARSTPATPSATSSATRSSPTSSTSTTATGRAGRSGPTRTSGCRGSSTPRPTARTCSASAT